MAGYRYRALDAHGDAAEGVLEAASETAAAAALQARGLYPLDIAEAAAPAAPAAPAPARAGARGRGVSDEARRHLIRQLATLLAARAPVDRALELIAETQPAGPARALIERLGRRVGGGQRLSEAVAAEGGGFGPEFAAALAQGEATGEIGLALTRLADLEDRRADLRASVRGALFYPLIVLVVAGASLIALLAFVLPRFRGVFAALDRPPPPLTEFLMSVGEGLQANFLLFVAGALLLAALAALAVRRLGASGVFGRAPIIGPYLSLLARERAARVLGSLIEARVDLGEALRIAGAAAGGEAAARAHARAAQLVREGGRLSDALEETGAAARLGVEMARIGEEAGELGPMMTRLADVYEAEAKIRTARLASMLAPLLTLGVGLLVGAVMLILVSSILEVYDAAL